ncbi:MAG: MAPEG family protein [Gammaproteobacteria bacterium]|nr:MAPEG family protein [Gammaproteobacteria bacterium]
MSATTTALLGYILWMLILLVILAGLRSALTLSGKKMVNSFAPDGADAGDFSNRLCRAHANCYESFPIIGGILLFALASGQTGVTDGLAMIMLGARVAQSLTHLISTSAIAVYVRFGFFLVQIAIAAYWLFGFFAA